METRTVSDMEGILPVGVTLPSGERLRDYGFRPWRVKDEIAIGEYRDRNRSISPGAFATHVLSHFLTSWCGTAFDATLPDVQKRLVLKQAWTADVLHAWLQLRRNAIGNDFEVALACPTCRKQFVYVIDLGSVAVKAVGDGEALTIHHDFYGGVEWKGSLRKGVTLAPFKWHTYESLGDDGLNLGAAKAKLLADSIIRFDGLEEEVRIPHQALDEMTKYDMEMLTARQDEIQPGPDLSIEVECPAGACRSMIRQSIPWMYDAFFSVLGSSQSGLPRRYSERSSA